MVVFRCPRSEEAVQLAIFKKKSGPGPMGLDLLELEICRNISFCSFSMDPKYMKYQEIKKSNCVWSRKIRKKAFS